MKFTPPGKFKSAAAFRDYFRGLDAEMDCDLELHGSDGSLGNPLPLRNHVLKNRFVIHPMEGWDGTPEGLPSENTLRRWKNFGLSGAKLIWGGEAFAVQQDGRANPNQLYLNPDADVKSGLALLRQTVLDAHQGLGENPDEVYIGLQLTHSGRFSRPTTQGAAPCIAYHHPVLDKKFGIDAHWPILTDAELEGIAENYVIAARLAADCGFQFVDVKCCHGYLLHELLGARPRAGSYGGSFEGRTALFRRIVADIRRECPGLEIGVRVSIADVYPHFPDPENRRGAPLAWEQHVPFGYGFGIAADDPRQFDLEEPFLFLQLLQDLQIRLVNLTLGSPYYCPHLQRPAIYPPSDGYLPPRDPLFEVIQHLRTTHECKRRFPELIFVGTGYTYLQDYLPHVAQYEVGQGHVDLVGLGRLVLSYPQLPHDVLNGRTLQRKLVCRTFSDCTTGPRNGLISGCFPLDPYYKKMPEAAEVKRIKQALKPTK